MEWIDAGVGPSGTLLGTVTADYDQRPVSQTFQLPGYQGIYLILLRVTDQFGNVGMALVKVMVFPSVVGNLPFAWEFVDGPLGDNGWYTGPVSVAWAVFPDWATTAGCETTVIDFDTSGASVTCEVTAFGITTSETVTVRVDQTPPVVNIVSPSLPPGEPLVVDEGSNTPLEAVATDAISGVASILWDLDEDGVFESTNPANFTRPDGAAGATTPQFLVAQALDQAGNASEVTLEAFVKNVPPNVGAVALSPESIHLGGTVEASALFTDPGILDTHTATINWGDGTVEPVPVSGGGGSGSVESAHPYLTPGNYLVTITVTDKDNGVGASSAVVTVLTGVNTINDVLIPGTDQLVNDGRLTEGQGLSLIVKLEGAKTELLQGDVPVAINKLSAFRNEWEAKVGGTTPNFLVANDLIYALEATGGG